MNKRMQKKLTRRFSCPTPLWRCCADKRSKGFTLVELAVVLTCMAVLAVTLLPAFASAKPNSRAFQCLNNLRQWGIASQTMAGDNNDMLARDGTDNVGQYAVDSGSITGPGSPVDPYAWFNTLPQLVGSQPLSYYYGLSGLPYQKKYPFPDNDVGKIWMCPSAMFAGNDVFGGGTAGAGGKFGFFCYVMNMDLKATTPIGISYGRLPYPLMPKMPQIKQPSATVLLTETAFSPTLERYLATASDAGRNGIFPCARSYRFSMRHNNVGGGLVFLDAHSEIFKRSYITNGAPDDSGVNRAERKNNDVIWNPNRDIP